MATQRRHGTLPRGITPNRVLAEVADYFNIPLAEMLGDTRGNVDAVQGRQLAAHLLHTHAGMSAAHAAQAVCRHRTSLVETRTGEPDAECVEDLEEILGIKSGQSK